MKLYICTLLKNQQQIRLRSSSKDFIVSNDYLDRDNIVCVTLNDGSQYSQTHVTLSIVTS